MSLALRFMVVVLKQVGTVAWARDMLKISVLPHQTVRGCFPG